MERPRIIRNATVLTFDPEFGEMPGADVLIAQDRIAAVGPQLLAPQHAEVWDASGMVLMPGLVNAHIHAWQFGLRGIGADWVSSRDYNRNIHSGMAQYYEAEDNYVAILLGALAQVHCGTTTLFEWCHNLRDPQMADASIQALQESGIRAVFGHGTTKPPPVEGQKPYWEVPHPAEEIRRLRTGTLASDTARVTLAMAILGADDAGYDVFRANVLLAREFGLVHSAHTWGRKGRRFDPDGMWRIGREGLLGPDHNISHGNNLEDDELAMVLDHGCSISATPLTEMLNNDKPALLGRVTRHGAIPSLGSDVDPYFNASMLAVARHAFGHQRELDNRELAELGAWPSAQPHATKTRDALAWAITGGARALRLDHRIGSITPGKQADLILVRHDSPNVFPAVLGDPAHAVLMYAEPSDIDTVVVGGRVLKRDGKLTFPQDKLDQLRMRLLASRERIMNKAGFRPAAFA